VEKMAGDDSQLMQFPIRRPRQRGSSVIEFALASIVLLMFLFGIIDCARAAYTYEFVTYAARKGVRYAIVHGSACVIYDGGSCTATAAQIQSYVTGLTMAGLSSTAMTVTVTWPTQTTSGCSTVGTNNPGCPVQVAVSYNYSSILPFLRLSTIPMYSVAQAVISQ
jgi:Flp pilus assembly protein TadG